MESCEWQAQGQAVHVGGVRLGCVYIALHLLSFPAWKQVLHSAAHFSTAVHPRLSVYVCVLLRCRYVRLNADPAQLPSDEYAFNEACGSRILSAPSSTSARSSAAVGADGKRTGPKAPQALQAGSLLQRPGPPP